MLYVGDSPDVLSEVLLDPNLLSSDGTVAVTSVAVSRDGALLAWATSVAGSDWLSWRVRDTATGVDLDDVVEQAKFSGATWLPDGSGFLYSAPEPPTPGEELVEDTRPMRLLLHRLGEPHTEDTVVFRDTRAAGLVLRCLDHRGRLARGLGHRGHRPAGSTARSPGGRPERRFHTALVPEMSTTATVIDSSGGTFYVLTDDSAERGRLVAIDLADPARDRWREVVAPGDATLLDVVSAGEHFLCHWLRDASSELTVHARGGELVTAIDVAPATTVSAISGHPGQRLLHWTTTSAADPGTLHRHDLATGGTEVIRRTRLGVDLAPVVSEQVFVTSADGTRVPVFLTHRADVTPSGEVATLLYGYGGFNVAMTPSFAPGMGHCGWSAVGSSPWPACAVVVSTARAGMTPDGCTTRATSSTTPVRWPSGSPTAAGRHLPASR